MYFKELICTDSFSDFSLIKGLLTRPKRPHDAVQCSSGTQSNLHPQFYLVQIIWAESKVKIGPLGQQLKHYSQKAKVNVVLGIVTAQFNCLFTSTDIPKKGNEILREKMKKKLKLFPTVF